MAIIEEERPLALEAGETVTVAEKPLGALSRPQGDTGWKSWLFTVDHKRIGILYGAAAIVFFVVGGVEALLIRIQLARPEQNVLNADLYNQVFTMHGVTMLFLVGTRDRYCDVETLRTTLTRVGAPTALHVAQEADQHFKVLKRSGRTEQEVHEEVLGVADTWIDKVLGA